LSTPTNAYKGIKGPTFVTKLISLPDDAIIDVMHCADEGITKHLLKLWFSPKHHRLIFYLLPRIHTIDEVLKKVKYPKEIHRTQKSLTQAISYFHANEFRSLSTYSLIYLLMDKFTDLNYYYNLVKYILFLRLVRQNYVSNEDNQFAQILINSFVEQFPILYGTKNVTHNIHTSLHIPTQIARHGNKCEAYAGENCFKELKQNCHGTTHISRQIAINTNIQNKINSFLTNNEVEKFEKFELKNLHVKLQQIKNQNHKYLNQKEPILIDSTTINLYETIGIETRLLVESLGEAVFETNTLETSLKVFYDKKC
jgi:hypothetical protein